MEHGPPAPDFGAPRELRKPCRGAVHPKAREGIALFDAREYWHAHEALEEAWLDEAGPVRHLYRGILQAGVVYLHVQQENYRGAVKVYHRSRRWLDPFPNHCRGVDVGRLREELETVYREVRRLGPDRLDELDHDLLKPIHWVSESQQDH